MKPLYILLEIYPCKKLPPDVTDLIAGRVHTMDWVDKTKSLTATILSCDPIGAWKDIPIEVEE